MRGGRTAASSIWRIVSGLTAVGGPSSTIFWKRRCIEQSRPERMDTFRCLSAITCTSMCRAPSHRRMRKMGEPLTSSATCRNIGMMSARHLALRTPLPPPPSDALIMIG